MCGLLLAMSLYCLGLGENAPNSAFGLYLRANLLIELGKVNDAHPIFQQSLGRDEELSNYRGLAHFQFAILHTQVGKRTKRELEESIRHCDLAWKYQYQIIDVLLFRSALNKELKNIDAALIDLRRVVLIDSKTINHRVTLIETLTDFGRWQDASEELASFKRMSLNQAEKLKYTPVIDRFEEAIAKGKLKSKGKVTLASDKWELDFHKAAEETRKLIPESSFPPKP